MRTRWWASALGCGLVLGLLLVAPGSARAQSAEPQLPPVMPKVGPWMFNLKIGPAFGIHPAGGTVGSVDFQLGYAVTPDRNGYLLFAPRIYFAAHFPGVILNFPLGFEYDVRLISNLYLTPSLSVGYALFTASGGGGFGTVTGSAGVLTPAVGLKYVAGGRYNFGFEPFAIPVMFGKGGAVALYQIQFFFGVNF